MGKKGILFEAEKYGVMIYFHDLLKSSTSFEGDLVGSIEEKMHVTERRVSIVNVRKRR